MSQSKGQLRYKTEENIDSQLDKMLFMAAEQKMLPKIIYQYCSQHRNPKFLNQYREHVKQIYTKQTANPLIYNEDEAKTNRQKFRQKIIKLVNNQLPIDYLKPMKINGKFVMTYKGEPLQKVQYPTQPQFKIFNDFSQSKFKNGFQDVFDDKLQYKHLNVIRPIKKQITKKAKTTQFIQLGQTQPTQNIVQKQSYKKRHQTEMSIPTKLIARSLFEKHRLLSPLSPKKKIKSIKPIKQSQQILNIMKKIGGYYNVNKNDISITKQSILKYFREFYPRPHRIVDFLQFLNVQNFYTFSKIPMKLKLMPNQHIYFMAFLFYDSNNDGYICNNDLIRMEQMVHKSKLVLQDYQIIKKGAFKIKFETQLTYKQLYRLPQVTQSTFFQWLKKQKTSNQNPEIQNAPNAELKDYFEHLNRRKIFIHYQGFKKLFANEKPYLWYDILWRLSGIQYEGLSYQ